MIGRFAMPLLLDEHRHDIEARVAGASSLVFYLDFDGTLAPIVAEPELACMAPETRATLEELSRREGILVCVVSGRSLADIKSRVGLPGLVYSGNHGLEIESESLRFVHPEAGRCRTAIEDINRRLAGLPLLIPGVQLQHKGLSTTVHYRRADSLARAPDRDHRQLARSGRSRRPRGDRGEDDLRDPAPARLEQGLGGAVDP